MAGNGEQGYGQSFYQSGYDMDAMQHQAPSQAQQGGWQQASARPAQEQWSGTGQQAYYSPPVHDHQAYGRQGSSNGAVKIPVLLYTSF